MESQLRKGVLVSFAEEAGKTQGGSSDAAIGDDRRDFSGGNGQGGGPAFGRDGAFHQLTRLAFATAAAGGATGLRLHRFKRVRTARDGAADVLVGDGFADADVHGGLRRFARRAPFERECE